MSSPSDTSAGEARDSSRGTRAGSRPAGPDGVVVVDKPGGITSHDVVARLRRALGTRKVGHAGTLDPMATGVLIAGVGRATRLLTYMVGLDKVYQATIRLGEATTTDDAEGESLGGAPASGVSSTQVSDAVARLTGDIQQVPSAVSAIKVDGVRSYARVRAGQSVELAARPVHIARFEVYETRREGDYLDLDVEVECSSGTYIRALARDLGAALGVGGHLTALRRTRVGPFSLNDALALDHVSSADLLTPGDAARRLLPVRTLTEAEVRELSFGRPLAADQSAPSDGAAPVAALTPTGALAALIQDDGARARPLAVFL